MIRRSLRRLTGCWNRSAGPLICSTFPNSSYAIWPHLFCLASASWAIGTLTDAHDVALIVVGAAATCVGVWLGRVCFLAGGGLAVWCGLTMLAPSPTTLIVSGLGLVAVSIWLSLASSPVRRWLAERQLPGAAASR